MAKITFNFSGYIRNANIESVFDTASGQYVDVTNVPREKVAQKLDDGVWAINLQDYLYEDVDETHVEFTRFEC